MGIISDYAALEERVASIPQDLLLAFTDADIARARAEPAPASRIELRMTPGATERIGAALEASYTKPFRVSCNGQPLFVGLTYIEEGAAAIAAPVLHAARDGDALVLHLGAQEGAWPGYGTVPVDRRERIDRPELRSALCRRGVLEELPPR